MRLEGSLDAFSLPDIFSLLSMTKKTGGLHLRRDDAHGAVWLADGLITGATSDLSHLTLGRRLAASGQVDDEDLAAAVTTVGDDASLGIARALRDAEGIDDGDLHALVAEHVVDSVFDLMRWPDGEFEFVIDEPNRDDVGVTREVDEVVTEARHRIDVWSAIDDQVTASDTVLSLTLDPIEDPQLQREEWALLVLVDGRRTVLDLVRAFGRGEYAVVVALGELVGRGLVRTNDDEGVAALLRRQDLVATLEVGDPRTATRAGADDRSNGADDDAEESLESLGASAGEFDADINFLRDDDGESVSDVTPLSKSAVLSRELASVSPDRSEPFLPLREPDHPEPVTAMAASGGGAAAMPAGLIERDPSVNKSLLLRLIAGVRGL